MMKKTMALLALFMTLTNLLMAQWQFTEGIYGADVWCSLVKDSSIFVGTGNGVYRSKDNGKSWVAANNGLPKDNTYNLAVSGINIFAATAQGVYLSTDNGANWLRKSNGLSNLAVRGLIAKGTDLIAGTASGIYNSSDNGNTWTLNTNLNYPYMFCNALVANDTRIFAGTSAGLYFSSDNGRTWSVRNADPTFPRGDIACLAVNGTKVVAATDQSVFLSTDSGQSWTDLNFNQRIYSVALSGANIYLGVFDALYVTSNNGGTWVTRNNGLTKRFIFSLTTVGNKLIAGTRGGVFFSDNEGNDWTESTKGLTNISIYSFATKGTDIYTGTRFGNVYLASTSDNKWAKINNNMNSYFYTTALMTKDSVVFAGSDQGLYTSTNKGNSWTLRTNGFPTIGSNFLWELAANAPNVFAANGANVYKSVGNGDVWTLANTGLLNWQIVDLVSDGSNIYALANGDATTNTSGVFLSTDNGNNWQRILLASGSAEALLVKDAHIFITMYSRGVLLFTKNGTNWTEIRARLANTNVTSLATIGTKIFVGTYASGVFLSTDNGDNWQPINDGLTTMTVSKLIVNNQYVWAGTDIGVFKRPLSELTVSTKENQAEFNCSIYPNPVSNTLTINCSDALIGQKYVIQNVLGETLETAILTNVTTTLSVKNWAKGLYFLHLVGTSKTIKFVKE
jgi:photosystem II stability/assembly factor-like uncharacterized protein